MYQKEETKVNAMQLSATKAVVYLLSSMIILGAAYLLLYDGLMYYLFQLFLGWAFFLRFMVLFAISIILIFLCDYIDRKLFGNQIRISYNKGHLELATEKHSYKIPYEELKSITLTQKNDSYSALEIHAGKALHFTLGSWTSNLKDPLFGRFWDALKKELQQKDFQHQSNSGKHNKTTVVRETLCADYTDYLNQQKTKRRKTYIFLALYFLFIIGLLLYLIPKFGNDGISIYNGEKIGSSYFEKYQNQVYFLKIGDGYFPLPGADQLSFKSLQTEGEIYSQVGADDQHVYWQDQKLPLLNPSSSIYLGGNYTKDTRNVYFRDQLLKNVDVSTFQAVRHLQYNTPVYNFGKDRNTVFYKNIPLHGLQSASVQSFENSSRYIKDQQNVFYKNTWLKGLAAEHTKIYDSENYRTAYATDGRKHYLNERPIPDIASNKYFGSTTIDQNTFKLLIPSGEGSYLFLFCDARHLYFYDENAEKMVMIYQFSKPVGLRPLENGSFTDGAATYTLNVQKIATRSKALTTVRGYKSDLLRLEKLQEPTKLATYAATKIEWKEDD